MKKHSFFGRFQGLFKDIISRQLRGRVKVRERFEGLQKTPVYRRGFFARGTACLVLIQFYIATEALDPHLGTAIAREVFQVTARAVLCLFDRAEIGADPATETLGLEQPCLGCR